MHFQESFVDYLTAFTSVINTTEKKLDPATYFTSAR
jgi:hypothetical protein